MPLVSFLQALRAGSAAFLCLLVAANASAAAPTSPQVTAGADTKQLQFDWEIVPRSNYYEFWYEADSGAPWVKFSELRPWQTHAVNNIAAHLFNWDEAQYMVSACQPAGCVFSIPVPVHDQMFESIGYFKASGSYRNGQFGAAVAISEDGQTLAAFAGNEPVGAGHIASVYVFTKVNGAWQQQRRIVPSTTVAERLNVGLPFPGSGALSLSADGNRLMTSMPVCTSASGTSNGGTCYQLLSVWSRSGSTWTREYQSVGLRTFAPATAEMNEAGDRIVYQSWYYQQPMEILERTTNGWVKHAPIAQTPSDYFCERTRLSGDGATLVRVCSVSGTRPNIRFVIAKAPDWNITQEVEIDWPGGHGFGDFAIDYAGTTLALGSSTAGEDIVEDPRAQVLVYKLVNGAFSSTVLYAGNWAPPEYSGFGSALALSRDGGLLAVYNGNDRGLGRGVLSPPLQPAPSQTLASGATSIYELRSTGPRLRRVLKPNGPLHGGRLTDTFGFANNGRTLLVADPTDQSKATGINGDRNDTSLPSAGALWLY